MQKFKFSLYFLRSLFKFCCQLFAFLTVSLLPVHPLAVDCAVECLFALRTYFVFYLFGFWWATVAAKPHCWSCCTFIVFCVLYCFFMLMHLLIPRLRCVMRPGIDMLNISFWNGFVRTFFRSKSVGKIILGFFPEIVKTTLEVFLD